jgi:hypothetical protein
MDSFFLREQPVVSLVESGHHTRTFIAYIFSPRPAFDQIKLWSEAWGSDAVEKTWAAVQRKKCAVSWIQFVVDQQGALVVMGFEHTLILGDAKRAAGVLLRCIPDEATRVATVNNLRPMDEVDADRIQAWQTVASLRPVGKKRAREED